MSLIFPFIRCNKAAKFWIEIAQLQFCEKIEWFASILRPWDKVRFFHPGNNELTILHYCLPANREKCRLFLAQFELASRQRALYCQHDDSSSLLKDCLLPPQEGCCLGIVMSQSIEDRDQFSPGDMKNAFLALK